MELSKRSLRRCGARMWGRNPQRETARTAQASEKGVVEMGESRTPRPEPIAGDHYERVRWFVVDRPDGHRHSAGRSSHVPLDRA
jgi:hypothetical protein